MSPRELAAKIGRSPTGNYIDKDGRVRWSYDEQPEPPPVKPRALTNAELRAAGEARAAYFDWLAKRQRGEDAGPRPTGWWDESRYQQPQQ